MSYSQNLMIFGLNFNIMNPDAKIMLIVMTQCPRNAGPWGEVNKEREKALYQPVRIWYVANVQRHSLRPLLGNCPNICIPTMYLFRKYSFLRKIWALKPLAKIIQVQ